VRIGALARVRMGFLTPGPGPLGAGEGNRGRWADRARRRDEAVGFAAWRLSGRGNNETSLYPTSASGAAGDVRATGTRRRATGLGSARLIFGGSTSLAPSSARWFARERKRGPSPTRSGFLQTELHDFGSFFWVREPTSAPAEDKRRNREATLAR